MKKTFIILWFFAISVFSQTVMQDWEKVFDDTHVGRIDITIAPAYLAWIYSHVTSDSEFVAKVRFRNNHFDETLDSIGFRLRGNTSRNAQKKSFKVSINSFFKGRNFHGLEKLNLNGEHNDPSIVRSKLCFDLFRSAGLRGSRANYMEVYINNKYYGLYLNTEHIDEEFLSRQYPDDSGNLWKCLYPADLVYLGENPAPYISLGGSRPAYELSTNEAGMDFSKLIRLTRILKNTASTKLLDSLETTLDLLDALKYFSMNVLVGQWDDYWSNMNNYYLYHEPAENLIHVIPYDYDNTFGIDWFNINWSSANPYTFPKIGAGERPLIEKMIVVPEIRNLYTRLLTYYKTNVFTLPVLNQRIDSLRDMITPSALADTFRVLDYGFSFNQFLNSFSASSFSNQHVKMGIKQYILSRTNSIGSQLNYVASDPFVYKINYSPKNPSGTDSIRVEVSAFSNAGLDSVSIQLENLVTGSMSKIPMVFSPVPGTKKVEESDRYTAVIPPLGANFRGKITFRTRDNAGKVAVYPKARKMVVSTPGVVTAGLKINELLADNTTIPDSSGDFDDWIELYNSSNDTILLTGKYLTDKSDNLLKWRFTQPELKMAPKQFLVVWCDEEETEPGIHTNFKLSKSGELVYMTDTNGVDIIDSISFGPQTTNMSLARTIDGAGVWMQMAPTPGYSNVPVSVEHESVPAGYTLMQNFPNPFNPSTLIRYSMQESGMVSLKVYSSLGEEIAELGGDFKPAGSYQTEFNAQNLPSGVYFLRLSVNGFSMSRKMILIR